MTESSTVKQYIITVGLILGGAFSFTIFIAHLMGISHLPGDNVSLLNIIIFVFVGFFSGRQYRDRLQTNPLQYWQAYGYLIRISFNSAVVFGLFAYFYYRFISPSDIDFFIEQSANNLKAWGKLPDDQLNALMELYKSGLNASGMAFLTWLYQLFGCAIFSFLTASLVKSPERK
jgi:hypothetical protein